MKDLILKPGSFAETISGSSSKIPGSSLEKYIVEVLNGNTCCAKILSGATVQDSTIVLKTYTTAQIAALTGMVAGTLVYDSTATSLKFYNGSAWETVTSS